MSDRLIWWSILLLLLVPLVMSAAEFFQHRRRGTAWPEFSATTTLWGVGYILFIVSRLLERNSALVWLLLAGSIALQVYAIIRWRRARRRAS